MSADNGIYIAKFPHGYRVAYAGAIDNVTYFPSGSQQEKDELRQYFVSSKVYANEEEAYKRAEELEREWDYLEYGIVNLGELPEFLTEEELKNLKVEPTDNSPSENILDSLKIKISKLRKEPVLWADNESKAVYNKAIDDVLGILTKE